MGVIPISYFGAASNAQFAYPHMQNSAAVETVRPQVSDASLIKNHARLVRHLARKYSNGSNIDDLEQEGYVALLEARRTWLEESQFWTYARRFVLGAMVRHTTSEGEEPRPIGDDRQLFEIESSDPSPYALLELAEGVSRLSASMIHLSEIERRIIRMHVGDDRSLANIARELGMSSDKVERTYRGALEKLRELQS